MAVPLEFYREENKQTRYKEVEYGRLCNRM